MSGPSVCFARYFCRQYHRPAGIVQAVCGRIDVLCTVRKGNRLLCSSKASSETPNETSRSKPLIPALGDMPGNQHSPPLDYRFSWKRAFGFGSAVVIAVGSIACCYYYKNELLDIYQGWRTWKGDASRAAGPRAPSQVRYLLVGGGTASFSAARAIRGLDEEARVLIVTDESYIPYMRPPLSKELWFDNDRTLARRLRFKQWNGRERTIFFEHEQFFVEPLQLEATEHGGVSVLKNSRVVRLRPAEHVAELADGQRIVYEKCLIATGGRPKQLPAFEHICNGHVTLFRGVDDFLNLEAVLERKPSATVAVVGGGFLGCELACALAKRGATSGLTVLQLFPESGCMAKVLPEYLSQWSTKKMNELGVKTTAGATITGAELDRHGQVKIQLLDGQTITADHVVVAVGLEPNVELAESSELELDPQLGGFLCDAELRCRSDIWVAGDCCSFYDVKLGRRRVEHHDHAVVSGRLAGENMTGSAKAYTHQSMFWSDLGPDVGYEAIGLVDSSLPTVAIFAKASQEDTPKAVVEATGHSIRSETEAAAALEVPPAKSAEVDTVNQSQTSTDDDYGKGVVFYLRGKRIVGILLWNVFNRMPIARKLLQEGAEHHDFSEVAKLFNLYGSITDNQ
ncbi:Apoptosis-inducing factor 1 [Trichinella spiralis]|uniref:Apoptosis-inducing factor 1, mitochondrial n=2 Tax=Trichinella spiralis TaxID=6334 RepID=E5SB57_TRISP|nr:drug resistance transporter, EmrB/QacA family [Trichinella spiralis]KRY36231.1 Apoptosis-inducing factor 1, mitochondrial [Trichinella spiralis]